MKPALLSAGRMWDAVLLDPQTSAAPHTPALLGKSLWLGSPASALILHA